MVAIAAISLLVGGIGIMNIVLATVMERTREIGVRRATGARRSDIVRQFLVESVLISVGGGIWGSRSAIFFRGLSRATAEWKTIVTPSSIMIAFRRFGRGGHDFRHLPGGEGIADRSD